MALLPLNWKYKGIDTNSLTDGGQYWCLVERLVYLAFAIAYVISVVIQTMHAPSKYHTDILKYLKGLPSKGVLSGKTNKST